MENTFTQFNNFKKVSQEEKLEFIHGNKLYKLLRLMACRFYTEMAYMNLDGVSYSRALILNPGSFFFYVKEIFSLHSYCF